jgi:hypothetical protein
MGLSLGVLDLRGTWFNRGFALDHLGRYKEAIASQDVKLQRGTREWELQGFKEGGNVKGGEKALVNQIEQPEKPKSETPKHRALVL